jgi:hypothetical protein
MGYWSEHPLAGDRPLDVVGDIIGFLCTKMTEEDFRTLKNSMAERGLEFYDKLEEAAEDDFYKWVGDWGDPKVPILGKVFARLFNENLEDLIETYDDARCFVIPFMIVDKGWLLTEQNFEKYGNVLFDMIGNGGGDERGYGPTDGSDEDILAEVVKVGKFRSPQEYASFLRVNFEKCMRGDEECLRMLNEPGLLATIFASTDEDLVNKP